MIVANATGCSSIYGGSAPTCPLHTNNEGHGPAWANSLFEDNAEFGFGMNLAYNQRRAKLADTVRALIAVDYCWDEIKTAGQNWLDNMNEGKASKTAGKALLEKCKEGIVEGCTCEACTLAREVVDNADLLTKKSFWIFGGDGWPTISATADWTMCWPRTRMSTCSCWIPRSTPTPADSPPRPPRPLHRQVRCQRQAHPRRRTWA